MSPEELGAEFRRVSVGICLQEVFEAADRELPRLFAQPPRRRLMTAGRSNVDGAPASRPRVPNAEPEGDPMMPSGNRAAKCRRTPARWRHLGLSRGLVAIGYDLRLTRGKARTSCRSIDLDTATLDVLTGWRASSTP